MSPFHIIPSIAIVAALITDIRSHKIPNVLVLITLFACATNAYYFWGAAGLKQGAVAAAVALAMTLPLVLIGVLGAGDMKLLFAIGFTITSDQVFTLIVISFFWAAIVGILFSVVRGKLQKLILNALHLLSMRPHEEIKTQNIPYMIPIFLSWLTLIYFQHKQGAL